MAPNLTVTIRLTPLSEELNMTLVACGINHQSAPIAIRERLAFQPNALKSPLLTLVKQAPIHEAAILSTCNRTEFYCNAENSQSVLDWLTDQKHLQKDQLSSYTYLYQDQEAVRHMMRVACGLDSMMLGETQIIGQMKQAYHAACETGTIGTVLRPCFEHVFHAAKKVRATTHISQYAVSVAAAAVDSLQAHCNLQEQTVLLIGAGETIELCAEHLVANQAKSLLIANRTLDSAKELAERYQAQAYDIGKLNQLLVRADIVITATACPLPFLSTSMLEEAMVLRGQRPIILIDLAVPRDIETDCAALPHVQLYNIDDLKSVVSANKAKRQEAALEAEQLIIEQASHYQRWQRSLHATESIRHYRSHVEVASAGELQRAKQLLSQGNAADDVLDEFAHRLINKIMHQPSVRLREAGENGRDDLLIVAKHLFDVVE